MQSKITISISGLGLLLVAVLGLSPAVRAAGPGASKEISGLLSDAQRTAYQVSRAAAEMEQYRLSRLGWETHTLKLTEIKELVNTTVRTVAKLNERRGEASPQQQQEIERITRALGPVVTNMEVTLAHLRENQRDIENCVRSDPHYKNLLKSTSELADKLAGGAQRRG
jgi:hypothetical protein